jgi:hypothetical protein
MILETIMVIRGGSDPLDDQPLFWSNQDGWVDLSSAEAYTEAEVKSGKFDLPYCGEWINLRSAISELVEWTEQGKIVDA